MNPIALALCCTLIATTSANSFGNKFERNAADRNSPIPENGYPVNNLHPTNWMQKTLQSVPSVESISYENLKQMPTEAASTLMKAIFRNSYLQPNTGSLFTPNVNEIKMYLITSNGNVSIPLSHPSAFKDYPQLSNGEVTVFVTGFPSNSEDPNDAVSEFIEAYRARYQMNGAQTRYTNSWDNAPTGNLIVIDLGNSLDNFEKWATLDIEETGNAIGQALVTISENVPYYNMHLIGHSVGAHVAGTAAKYFTQEKGTQLRRVTGLDPSMPYTKEQRIQSELNRGAADFVDVIHTTSYGLGTESNGDADFYPNGPGSTAPGSDNIIEASNKAVRYYSETVQPGNERNFMAVECNSLKDYVNHRCNGIRVPMGYSTQYDVEGDFVLRTNPKAPYGEHNRDAQNNRNSQDNRNAHNNRNNQQNNRMREMRYALY